MSHRNSNRPAGRLYVVVAIVAALLWLTPVAGARAVPEPQGAAVSQDVAPPPAPDDATRAEAAPVDVTSADALDPAAAGDIPLSDAGVEAIQTSLKQLGYFSGPADDRKGPRLRTAVLNFQHDQGLPETGSLDQTTVERIQQQVELAHVDAPASTPADVPVAPAPASQGGGGHNPATAVGGAVKTTGKAVGGAVVTSGKAVVVGGKATVDATKTAGEAVGTAGAVTGKSVGTAGKVVGESAAYAGTTVAKGTMAIYDTTRRAFVGDKRTDEDIRQGIERQFAGESRIVPGEIDVKVVKGNVTLALPDGARSDIASATRLARLTPGVKSVTTVYVSVETYVPPQTPENTPLPAPVVEPADMSAPLPEPVAPPAPVDAGEPQAPPVQP